MDNNKIQKEIFDVYKTNATNSFFKLIKVKPFSIFVLFISAFLFSLGSVVFLAQAKTIPSGLTALPTLVVYLFPSIKWAFSLLFILFNIPILLIFWKHIKKPFLYLTLIWLFFQIIWGLILNIPAINNYIVYHISIEKDWNVASALEENKNLWPVIYYTLIGSVLMGTAIGLSWKFGGSTAGSDIVSYYFSTKKKKPVGKIILIISISISFFSLVVFGTLGYFNLGDGKIYQFLGIQVVSTLIYVIINSLIVNKIYPKYKKLAISFYTHKPEVILEHLKKINYWHGYTVSQTRSGYTGKDVQIIETVLFYTEHRAIIKEIQRIEPEVWITVKPIQATFGKFDTSRVD